MATPSSTAADSVEPQKSVFHVLLKCVEKEHETELAALRAELDRFRHVSNGDLTTPKPVEAFKADIVPPEREPIPSFQHLNGFSEDLIAEVLRRYANLKSSRDDGFSPSTNQEQALSPTCNEEPSTPVFARRPSTRRLTRNQSLESLGDISRSDVRSSEVVQFQLLPAWIEHSEKKKLHRRDSDLTPANSGLLNAPYAQSAKDITGSKSTRKLADKRMSVIRKTIEGGVHMLQDRDKLCKLWLQIKPTTFFMNPREKRRITWDVFGIFILSFDLIFISLQAFEPQETSFTKICSYITLAYWTFDVVASVTTGYYTKDGRLKMKFGFILWRYLRTWFLFDLLVLGVDWLMLIAKWYGSDSTSAGESLGIARLGKIARMARIVRSVRLLRLLKIRQLMQAVQESIDSEMISIVMGMLKNTLVLLMINHSIACIWFLVGRLSSRAGKSSWTSEYGLDDALLGKRYIVSLHWSLTQFTPGSMHVQPQNTVERTFAVVVLVFGMLVFSSFVSSITSSMARLRNLKAWENTQSFLLRKFLKENQISRDLSARVTRYIDLVMERHQKRTDPKKVEFLGVLSGPLHLELQRELIEPHLINHPWFIHYAATCSGAMNQLCFSGTSQTMLSKGDVLFRTYSDATQMYFVASGSMYYRRIVRAKSWSSLKRIVILEKGNWFCEAVLWLPWSTRGTMRSLIESELILLDRTRFKDITVAYRSATSEARGYAAIYAQHLTETAQKYGQAWDLPIDFLLKESKKEIIDSGDEEEQEVQQAEVIEATLMNESDSEDEEEDFNLSSPSTSNINIIDEGKREGGRSVVPEPLTEIF